MKRAKRRKKQGRKNSSIWLDILDFILDVGDLLLYPIGWVFRMMGKLLD